MEVEEFDVYCPIVMANIWGLENVLQDRCITVILEKSSKKIITRLIDDFDKEMAFQTAKGGLLGLTENLQEGHQEFFKSGIFDSVISEWNKYVQAKEYDKRFSDLFSKIGEDIEGRNLELFFPLFIIADICGVKILDETIETSKKIIKKKKEQDREENRDIQIYEFVAQYEDKDFVAVSALVREFKDFHEIDEKETWTNARSLGRGLRRLNLVLEDRRLGKGKQVILDIEKAKKQMTHFREPEIKEPDFKEELKGIL